MRRLGACVAVFAVVCLAQTTAMASQSAKASPTITNATSGKEQVGTFWFDCDVVPFGFAYHAAGTVWYNAYAGEPGWDNVYQDWDYTYVTDGNVGGNPCWAGALTYLEYYQETSTYVPPAYDGSYNVPILETENDSVISVGDHPDKNFYVLMKVLDVPGAAGELDACCGLDWAPFWAKSS
jgi:hypothetical protein